MQNHMYMHYTTHSAPSAYFSVLLSKLFIVLERTV